MGLAQLHGEEAQGSEEEQELACSREDLEGLAVIYQRENLQVLQGPDQLQGERRPRLAAQKCEPH